jgi:ketosteroid isomerase-like protein
MRAISIFELSLIILTGCNQRVEKVHDADKTKFTQHIIKQNNKLNTVGIDSFILITKSIHADEKKAEEVMEVKKKWPLAMQKKDRNLFEDILAKDFTFRAGNEFYNRKEYIQDRIKTSIIVDTALYENLVLQFFDNTALLTYRNIVTGKDSIGVPEVWQYSWADVYMQENGKWKIAGSHLIQELRLK